MEAVAPFGIALIERMLFGRYRIPKLLEQGADESLTASAGSDPDGCAPVKRRLGQILTLLAALMVRNIRRCSSRA